MKTALLLSALVLVAGTAKAQTWSYDAAHSSVAFAIKHLAVSTTRGEFDKIDAKLTGDAAKPTTLQADVRQYQERQARRASAHAGFL